MNEILKVENISKKYKGKTVVDNLNFSVDEGDIFGFLGPNGAGKSTSLKMILRLIKKDSGKVFINGYDIDKNFKEAINGVAAIIEKPAIYIDLTAYENLEIVKNLSETKIYKDRYDEVLQIVGLKGRGNEKVKNYSLGMKQRLAIAMALIKDPKIIILDEPTNGLDPKGVIEIRNLIKQLANRYKKTIIISSHILHEIEMMCNKVVIINKGKTILETDIESITNKKELFFIRTIDIESTIKVIDRVNYVCLKSKKKNGVVVQGNDASRFLLIKELVKNNIPFYEISSNNDSLEDIFIEVTGGK
ncbi:ABC transporter ATP-binding protein [Paraclostridium bifermentans]|uniref:ABC transporter ATP-binding protein n=1 Tax=Paraclostridium bifermentans TaxID=1490 RepID=UPI00359C5B0F